MKKMTIAVIGGYNGKAIVNQGKNEGVNVIHHDGTSPRRKELYTMAKKADSVVVLINVCGHKAQEYVKDACKELATPIVFTPGKGASSAIRKGMESVLGVAV